MTDKYESMAYYVISTKCPILNHEKGNNTLEVLVRLENTEPKNIICPEYKSSNRCALQQIGGTCIYKKGWG
jgi:hypothetical protein